MWDKPFSIVNISHYKVEVYSKGNRVISNSSLTANHGTEYYTLEVVDVYDGSCLPVVVCVSAANTVGLSPAGCVSDSALPNRGTHTQSARKLSYAACLFSCNSMTALLLSNCQR